MTGVNQLGYLIFGVSDLAAWRGLASSVLGMELVPGDTRSTTYLRMDEHSHRIELRSDGVDDLEVIGWEVPDAAALHAVAQRLENAGVRVKSGTRDEADQRRVVELIQFDDPAGIRTEVYYGPPLNQRPFHAPRAITGFKTGPMGLGHLVVYQPDLDASAKFYTELLGFRSLTSPARWAILWQFSCTAIRVTTQSPCSAAADPSESITSCSSATRWTTWVPPATSPGRWGRRSSSISAGT